MASRRRSLVRRRAVQYVRVARRKAAGATVPVAVLAGFGPLVRDVIVGYRSSGLSGAQHYLVGGITGYDSNTGKFNVPWTLTHFWLPVGAGVLAHKAAGWLGVNRALARAGVPILRV